MINKQVKSLERESNNYAIRTLPTGTISMNDVRNELKSSGTISLNQKEVRDLAKIPSGRISFNDLRGKSASPNPQDCDYYFETKEDFGNRIEQICKNHNYDLSNVTLGFADSVKELTYTFGTSPNISSFPTSLKSTPKKIIAYGLETTGKTDSENSCGLFYTTAISTVLPELFYYCPNIKNFHLCFSHTPNLKSIPENLFSKNISATSFVGCFMLSNFEIIPENLFSKNASVTDFSSCFSMSNVKIIPENLFSNCINAVIFYYTFLGCTDITTVPFKLFDKCKKIENVSGCFSSFWGDMAITSSLPDVWNKAKFPNVTDGTGYAKGCTKAANYSQIPSDFK